MCVCVSAYVCKVLFLNVSDVGSSPVCVCACVCVCVCTVCVLCVSGRMVLYACMCVCTVCVLCVYCGTVKVDSWVQSRIVSLGFSPVCVLLFIKSKEGSLLYAL